MDLRKAQKGSVITNSTSDRLFSISPSTCQGKKF